jgi:hypothetical protein
MIYWNISKLKVFNRCENDMAQDNLFERIEFGIYFKEGVLLHSILTESDNCI